MERWRRDGDEMTSRGVRARLARFTVVLGLLCPWASLDAQELGNDCDLRSFRVISSRQIAVGQRVTWISLPDAVCPDGVRIQADSAVVWEVTGRTEFIGRFRYEDPERELQSTGAEYFDREGRLFTHGQVQMKSRDGGIEVRGDTLNLYEVGEGRTDDRLEVTGLPAFASIQPSDATEGVEEKAPYEVRALRLRFEGEGFLYGDGEVEVDRDSLHATTRSLSFDRNLGNLILTGDARVESGGAQFEAGTISLMLPDDELTSMILRDHGRFIADELDLYGEEIQIDFADGEIQHLSAMSRMDDEAVPRGASQLGPTGGVGSTTTGVLVDDDSPRPRAYTEGFFLTADSLEVQAPGGVLQTVFAFGRASAESLERESDVESGDGVVDGVRPAPADSILIKVDSLGIDWGILTHDWIEGDNIVATLSRVSDLTEGGLPDEVGESSEYVLDRIVALGNARTLYRSPPNDQGVASGRTSPSDWDQWAISYLLADQIIVSLMDGRVEGVQAEGNVSGIQLEPNELPTPPDETTDPEVNP